MTTVFRDRRLNGKFQGAVCPVADTREHDEVPDAAGSGTDTITLPRSPNKGEVGGRKGLTLESFARHSPRLSLRLDFQAIQCSLFRGKYSGV